MRLFVARCRHVDDPTAGPDIIHDAMLEILAGNVRLPNDREKAWRRLLATIRNVARNRYRSEKVRRTEPLDVDPPSMPMIRDGREWGWRMCKRLERGEMLNAALQSLTADQREVVVLRYLKGWTIAEVAGHRGCSPSAVKQLSGKALAELRAKLEGRFVAE